METVEKVVVSGEGATVSLLVWRRFRRAMPGLVERILDLNPGLAELGLLLPTGTTVLMPIPATDKEQTVEPVRLWG